MHPPLAAGEFAKYSALGNDYLVIDSATFGPLDPARVRAICDRHHGVGSDGILLRAAAAPGRFGLRIHNPDGSEAEKSGNGLRIFARFLFDFGYTQARDFYIETPGGLVQAWLHGNGCDVESIEVAMGRASFVSSALPMGGPERDVVAETLTVGDESLVITAVNVGNPHCVCFVPKLDVAALRRLGPLIERHASFPRRTNVQFVHVRDRGNLDILIWERGVGETLASGSSSCATAAAAVKNGLVDGDLQVHMPGGVLAITVAADYAVTMRGTANPVCRGVLL